MNYRIIDRDSYYRKGVFRHFSKDCKCSTSMTARIDVTDLVEYSQKTNTKFYINFLYILSKVMNSREDYRMGYLWQTEELICYDVINPTQYVFHEDTETFTLVYTEYCENYVVFYANALQDVEKAKKTREYGLDMENHPNWFDASCIPWLSYDSLHIELPDGYLFFAPIVNWGKYRRENGRLLMPVTVRLKHAIADGYLVANVYRLLRQVVTLLWVFKLPWQWAYSGAVTPWVVQFAFGFYSIMITSTVLGLISLLLWKPRSWCVYCPMGTMTQLICKAKHE